MKKRTFRLVLVLLAAFLSLGNAHAAKPKPKPKPKATTSTHHETLGTQQLKGGFGEFGSTYTLGKTNPWNVRVKSAEYSVDTIAIGDRIVYPKADEKLLILHYVVHNPQQREAGMRFDTLRLTAVDAKDKNWEWRGDVGNETTGERVDQRFKPAQKMDVFAVLTVPAAGEIPKMMIQGSDELVIRYDLRGKVRGLTAPYADPADTTGATARAVVPAEYDVLYPLGPYGLQVNGTSFREEAIGNVKPDKKERLLVVDISVKNLGRRPNGLRFDTLRVTLKDADGVDIPARQDLYRSSSDTSLSVSVDPDQQIKGRLLLKINKELDPKSMVFSYGDNGRQFEFPVR
jgi:hypothetical protein